MLFIASYSGPWIVRVWYTLCPRVPRKIVYHRLYDCMYMYVSALGQVTVEMLPATCHGEAVWCMRVQCVPRPFFSPIQRGLHNMWFDAPLKKEEYHNYLRLNLVKAILLCNQWSMYFFLLECDFFPAMILAPLECWPHVLNYGYRDRGSCHKVST